MKLLLLLVFILFPLVAARHTRYWLLRLTNNDRADQIAQECGLVNRGLVSSKSLLASFTSSSYCHQVGRFHNVFQYEFKGGEDNKPYNNITESLRQYPEVRINVYNVWFTSQFTFPFKGKLCYTGRDFQTLAQNIILPPKRSSMEISVAMGKSTRAACHHGTLLVATNLSITKFFYLFISTILDKVEPLKAMI